MTNKDIIDIRLSQKASNVANRFKEEFFFPDAISAARFGFAYMLEKATEEDIYVWLMKSDKKRDDRFDSNGNNYAGATIDQGGKMTDILKSKFPDCDTPHQYIRLLMDAGLCELGEKILSIEDFVSFLND